MNKLSIIQQIAAGIACGGLTIGLHFLIANFRYIWVEEFGNAPFWKKGVEA